MDTPTCPYRSGGGKIRLSAIPLTTTCVLITYVLAARGCGRCERRMACYPSFTDPDKSEVWLNKTMQEVLKYMVQHGFRTAVFTDRINRQPYDGRNLGEYYSSGVQTAGFMKYLLDNFPHMCIESPVVQNFNYNSMTNASLIQAISFTPSAKLLKKSRAILPDNHRTADVFLERLAGHYRASLKATAKAVKLRYL